MFAEVAATLAIPRLVLFPLAAYFIGKEQFGVFMTAMSVALILGTQMGEGLSTGLLKHLSDYPEQQRMPRYAPRPFLEINRLKVRKSTLL
ncbi:MAG: hypothetical protein ABII09_04725 [Planctomycetota bacterium]